MHSTVTIKQMHHIKTQSPNSISHLFFKKIYHIVYTDITKFVIDVLNNCTLLDKINNTYITFIPEISKPKI